MPPKSEKKPQRKCFVCFWAHLNHAHDRRLPWHTQGLQAAAGRGAELSKAPAAPGSVESHPVLVVMFFKADDSFVVVK